MPIGEIGSDRQEKWETVREKADYPATLFSAAQICCSLIHPFHATSVILDRTKRINVDRSTWRSRAIWDQFVPSDRRIRIASSFPESLTFLDKAPLGPGPE